MNLTPRTGAVLLRRAVPGDARDINRLYNQAYSTDEREAKEQYPFPQVLDPGWIAEAVAGGSIAWVVAEAGGELVGSTAAVRNIGGQRDRIAEVFGVVVSHGARVKGVATRLLGFLCAKLEGEAEFILCEARTAEPGGWKVARNCGFLPVGFEPFAHAMPVGFESMVLTGKVVGDPSARSAVPPRLTLAAQALAVAVTGEGARLRPEGHGGSSPDPVGNDPFSTPAGAPFGRALRGPTRRRRGPEGARRMGGGPRPPVRGHLPSPPGRGGPGAPCATSGPTSSASKTAEWSAARGRSGTGRTAVPASSTYVWRGMAFRPGCSPTPPASCCAWRAAARSL